MGLEQGAIYTLTRTSGVAVFNDPTSADFVGYLSEPPSIGAEVRDTGDEKAQGDGGVHPGDFFLSRMSVVLTGIFAAPPGVALKLQIEKLQLAANALRDDAVLSWSESGDPVPRIVRRLRRQQRTAITDRAPRRFQVSLITTDPMILTNELAGVNGTTNNGVGTTQTNLGTETVPPRISLAAGAAALNPIFKNTTTGKQLKLNGSFAGTLVVDLLERTVTHNGVDAYGAYDFLQSSWWGLAPGANKIEVTDSNGVARTFTLYRRHGWSA